jgi:hypothetical protein
MWFFPFCKLTIAASRRWIFLAPFPGIPCGGGRLHTTGGGEVACSLPRLGQTASSCGTAWAQSATCRVQLLLLCSRGLLV